MHIAKSPVLGSCIIVFQLDQCGDSHLPKNLTTVTTKKFSKKTVAYYTLTSNKLKIYLCYTQEESKKAVKQTSYKLFIYLFCHTTNVMKTIKNRKNRFNNGEDTQRKL